MTFSEIARECGVSKGAVSKWLKGAFFSATEQQLISNHGKENRMRGSTKSKLTRQMQRAFNERKIVIEEKKKFSKLIRHQKFLTGLMLYWARGSFTNSYLQFSSSDTEVARIVISWIKTYIPSVASKIKFRIFVPQIDELVAVEHWRKDLNLQKDEFLPTVYTKSTTKSQENGLNNGYIQITAGGISDIRRVIVWKKLFLSYYQGIR